MISFLIFRPIGTSVIALSLFFLGLIVSRLLPISLLPDTAVPEITVQANYPFADVRQIQQIISTPIRSQLLQLDKLEDLEAVCFDGQVVFKLEFQHGTDIDLAYLEANEKIDMLLDKLPRDMDRPRVIKASSTDIPVFQLNVWSKNKNADFIELSNFSENVIKRRLEQLPEVAFVDATGLAKAEILIQPDIEALRKNDISINIFTEAISSQSGEIGNLTVRDGPYEYSVSFEATIRDVTDIQSLQLKIGDINPRFVKLGDFSKVSIVERNNGGLYSFNNNRSIGLAIVKQSNAQVLNLKKEIEKILLSFKKDYPQLNFEISQDQTSLLDLSINNLLSSLVMGAILSFIMIMFFMKDKKVILLIGIIIPISLSITLLGFYIVGLSINIVSLAGLVLGIGEIIDSAIIIIESIEQHLEDNSKGDENSLHEACVRGSEDVIIPLFTSVLTNAAVFIPLLFLSGIAGALFYDQAIAVALALGISLLTSYILIPVFYFKLYKKKVFSNRKLTIASKWSLFLYNKVFDLCIRRPIIIISIWLFLLISFFWLANNIKLEGMPHISHTDLETFIDWNEAISVEENYRRTIMLMDKMSAKPLETGIFIGQQQFLLSNKSQQSSTESLINLKFKSTSDFDTIKNELRKNILKDFPQAVFKIRPAQNIFEQLFQTNEAYFKIKLASKFSQQIPSLSLIDSAVSILKKQEINVIPVTRKERIELKVDREKLLFYDVSLDDLVRVLRIKLDVDRIGTMSTEQKQIPIVLGSESDETTLHTLIDNEFVNNKANNILPIKYFIDYVKNKDYTSFSLGREGSFITVTPIEYGSNIPEFEKKISSLIKTIPELSVGFDGSHYRDKKYINELLGVIAISIGVLFFVLAAQFESLTQPLVVLFTILFGLTGAFIFLYFAGNSLNIMSAIGLIVLIGLLDNDSILKIDTMNKNKGSAPILDVVRLGGQKRLQSQLMTFLTTVLGLLPILWSTGLGAELQKPLALSVIGGMFLGLFISWTFIPLSYYWMQKIAIFLKKVN